MTSHPISIETHPENGFILTAELEIERPLEEVFNFFSSAENLEAITPPWLHFQIVTPTPLNIREKSVIDYKLKLHGIPIRWRTEIAAWEPPYRFVDQQLRGPYKRWYHEHTFESLGPNRTLAKDRVHYIPRFGSLVHKMLVKPDLLKIFAFRQEQLARTFANRSMTPLTSDLSPVQAGSFTSVQ